MPAWCGTTSRRASASTYDLKGDGRTWSRRRMRPTTARWRPASCRASSPPPARCSSATPGPTPTATASCRPTRSTPPCRSSARARPTIRRTRPAPPRRPRVDPNVKNDRTREFIVGFDRQLDSQMAVGGSYIWRKYDRSSGTIATTSTSANYAPSTYPATDLPGAGARCEAVTYFEPTTQLPSPNALHEPPGPLPRLQRLRADLPEAHGEPLVGELQLRLQQRHRPLRFGGGVRRSDQHRSTSAPAGSSTRRKRPAAASATCSRTRSGCSRSTAA